jgi:hypothetical protein
MLLQSNCLLAFVQEAKPEPEAIRRVNAKDARGTGLPPFAEGSINTVRVNS